MTKVALSGADGQLGSFLRKTLPEHGVNLRSGGFRPLTKLVDGEDVVDGDLAEPAAVDRLLSGADVLIHLAGTSVEKPLPEVMANNLVALREVYEGARRHRVKRIVFASSNHAVGMHRVESKLPLETDLRPDGFYGLSKMWGEGMARMYWDRHGIEGVVVRIGSALPRPMEFRHLSTWFGLEDFTQFMLCCIRTPAVGYQTVWGASNNTRAYWTPLGCEAIGFRPVQNAEDYAAEILKLPNPLDPVAQRYQGGAYVTMDYTPEDQRP